MKVDPRIAKNGSTWKAHTLFLEERRFVRRNELVKIRGNRGNMIDFECMAPDRASLGALRDEFFQSFTFNAAAEDRFIYYPCTSDYRFIPIDEIDTEEPRPDIRDADAMSKYDSYDSMTGIMSTFAAWSLHGNQFGDLLAMVYDPMTGVEVGLVDMAMYPKVTMIIECLVAKYHLLSRLAPRDSNKLLELTKAIIKPVIERKRPPVGIVILKPRTTSLYELLTTHGVIAAKTFPSTIENSFDGTVLHFSDPSEYDRCVRNVPHLLAMVLT
jgi:hypothetical protein